MLWYAMLCYAMLCCAMPCYAMLCYAMLCYPILCYLITILCCAMLCYAMLCYAITLPKTMTILKMSTVKDRKTKHAVDGQNLKWTCANIIALYNRPKYRLSWRTWQVILRHKHSLLASIGISVYNRQINKNK